MSDPYSDIVARYQGDAFVSEAFVDQQSKDIHRLLEGTRFLLIFTVAIRALPIWVPSLKTGQLERMEKAFDDMPSELKEYLMEEAK